MKGKLLAEESGQEWARSSWPEKASMSEGLIGRRGSTCTSTIIQPVWIKCRKTLAHTRSEMNTLGFLYYKCNAWVLSILEILWSNHRTGWVGRDLSRSSSLTLLKSSSKKSLVLPLKRGHHDQLNAFNQHSVKQTQENTNSLLHFSISWVVHIFFNSWSLIYIHHLPCSIKLASSLLR